MQFGTAPVRLIAMHEPEGERDMPRITQTLPTTMMSRRQLPRGWVIISLALLAWIALLAAGYGIWMLVT